MQKTLKKFISALLAIAILVTAVPITVTAEANSIVYGNEEKAYNDIADTVSESDKSEAAYPVSEIVSKREANVKHYRMSDGSITAAVYPYDVHYEDADGNYRDIDNSFVDSFDEGAPAFSNKSNSTNVKFMKKSNANKLYTIDKNGYKIKVAIEGAEKTDAEVTDFAEAEDGDLLKLNNIKGQVTYRGILPNTDIQYTYTSTTLKENVIINEKTDLDSLIYNYHVTGSLEVVQDDPQSISVYEKGTDNIIFRVTAPAIYDNEGNSYDGLTVTLLESKNSKFKVRLDWEIPEGAVYPVTVDPVLNFRVDGTGIHDLHILGQYPNTSYDYNNHIRIRNNGYAMVQYPLPQLKSGDKIINAQLVLTPYCYAAPNETAYSMVNSYSPDVNIAAHEILREWNEVTDTYNTIQPENNFYDNTVIDYRPVKGDSELYTWDITKLANKWADGYSENHGVLLKFEEPAPDDWFDAFFISSYAVEVYYGWAFPFVLYQYINTTGIESYLSYHSFNAGYAGTVYTNDLTGNVTVVTPIVQTGGSLMPISVSLVYNMNNNTETPYGKSWLLNWSQRLDKSPDFNFNNVEHVRYRDGDGTEHYFAYDSQSGLYKDEIDPDRTLSYNQSNGKFTMTDSSDSKVEFTRNGSADEWYLTKVSDPYGNCIDVTLNPQNFKQVTKVSSSTGNVVDFTYSQYGFLTSVKYYDQNAVKTVNIEYNNHSYPHNNCIGKITFADNTSVEYYYEDNTNCLSRIDDIDGYHLNYSYTSGTPMRVSGMEERAADGTLGYTMSMQYEATATYFNDITNGRQYLYSFAKNGTLKSAVDVTADDGNGYATYYEYNGGSTEIKKGMNNLTFVSKTQKSTVNLLQEHSFEADGYYVSNGTSNGISADKKYMGARSYKVTGVNTGYRSTGSVSINVEAGTEYTLSAYVNTGGMTSLGGGASLYVDGGEHDYESEVIKNSTNEWQRISVTFVADANETVTLCMSVSGATGAVYFDCIQFEKGGLSDYNMLENAGFENGAAKWDIFSTYASITETQKIAGEKAVTAVGRANKDIDFRQMLYVPDGKKNDTYVASAFAKADSVPEKNWRFIVFIRFVRADQTTVNECVIPFNSYTDKWQKTAGVARAADDYAYIQFWLLYYRNCNRVYFDNVQLVKDTFGNAYEYDSEGNLITVKDLQEKEENTFTYDGNNQLIKQTNVSGSSVEYVYDPDIPTQLNEVKSGGLTTRYVYDSHGNVTYTETKQSNLEENDWEYLFGPPRISSSATYSDNGEYLTSITDSREKTTYYTYNEYRGYLTSETNPNGITTEYLYNNSELLTEVKANLYDEFVSVQYNYDSGKKLTSLVSASGTTYSFTYDSFARNVATKVGDRTLSTYTYNEKGLPATMTYGNGTVLSYGYDSLNRQTSLFVDNELKYAYRYDGMSRLSELLDKSLNRKSKFEYDILGRPVAEKYIDSTNNTVLSKLNLRYDDSKNRFAGYDVSIGNVSNSYDYTYNTLNPVRPDMIMGVTQNGSPKISYTYDELNRLSTRTVSTAAPFETTYSYLTGEYSDEATPLVENMTVGNEGYSYYYDDLGNIRTIYRDGLIYETYGYDWLNQLTSVYVDSESSTYTYSYDDGGNIQTVTKNGETIKTYTYGDPQWKDLLTAYNGNAITYDGIGNPLTYYDGSTFTWSEGRKLTNISKGTDNYSYEYDANGLRTSKTVNGTKTEYYWLNGTLFAEKTGNRCITFHYDEAGTPYGFTVTEGSVTADYYYAYNLQGDVIGIINSAGTKVVEYSYNTWGELLSITGTLASTIGHLNPIRYRGYYYDTETGFYYCRSRYYDPGICRWINLDGFVSTGQGILSNNMFAYCDNNPVMYVDHYGTCKHTWYFLWLTDCKACKRKKQTIKYDVPLYEQGEYRLCWAFCQVMVESYSKNENLSPEAATEKAIDIAKAEAIKKKKSTWNRGGWPTNKGDEVIINNINDLYVTLKENGPLYASYTGADAHLIVITGVNLYDNCVYTNNPWGIKGVQTYDEFVSSLLTSRGTRCDVMWLGGVYLIEWEVK